MKIDLFEFHPAGAEKPTTLGLNIQRKYGLTHVNLFALSENEGQPISKNFWSIATDIIKNILMDEKIDNTHWTLTSGRHTTGLRFSTLNGNPYKLDVSDKHALTMEQFGGSNYSIHKYERDFEGQPPTYVAEGRIREIERDPFPQSVFSIPCSNPKARDGVFHCIPSFYEAEHMRDDYEFMLVDTKKIIALLQKGDPAMIDHVKRKLSGSTAEKWLESTSMEYPRDMGLWNYSKERGLVFCSGQAALIKVAEDLNLPYFPIAIEKASGQNNIDELRMLAGYGGPFSTRQPSVQPIFD